MISALSIAVQSLLYWPKRVFVESSSVYFLLSDMTMRGRRKSFQTQRTFVMHTVAVMGLRRGNTMYQKT